METKLVFLRRTQKEIEIFGGEVYIDVDGKNIGVLGTSDFNYSVTNGQHKIRMYKSHTYGSFIGSSDAEILVSEGESLLIKYSSPMLINQPGTIIITDFKSSSQTDLIAKERDVKIVTDDNDAKQKQYEQEQKSSNGVLIFVVIMIVSTIIYLISMASIMNR
jgi:hypothetical protein